MLVSFLPSAWLNHLSSQLNSICFWDNNSNKVLLKQIQSVMEKDDQTVKTECPNFPVYKGKDTLVLSSSLFTAICLKYYLFAACDLYFVPLNLLVCNMSLSWNITHLNCDAII